MRLQGFFHCPCGKLHTYSCIGHNTRCPQCGRALYLVAIQPDGPLTVRETMTRLGAPRVGEAIEGFLQAHRERESAPRLACGVCQFEYTQGNPQRHSCKE